MTAAKPAVIAAVITLSCLFLYIYYLMTLRERERGIRTMQPEGEG